MIRLTLISFLLGMAMTMFAAKYTGIYSYNKGMNKASSTMYISEFTSDSAFFMLQAMSGAPDFYTTEIKGFISIENEHGTYKGKDSCSIDFTFNPVSCTLVEHNCKYDFSTEGKYKKTSSQLKKGFLLMPAFSDKHGIIKADSTYCYSIPHQTLNDIKLLMKNDAVNITDEFNGFYLIELKNKKNEFLWVLKKNVQLLKNK